MGLTRTICNGATNARYSEFEKRVSLAKRMARSQAINALSNGEVAFYTDCGNKLHAFFQNMYPDDMKYTNAGLSETTLQLIRDKDPLLLEKGPDGYTALEHVQRRIEDAHRSSSSVVQGIYSMIKGKFEQEIRYRNSDEYLESIKTR